MKPGVWSSPKLFLRERTQGRNDDGEEAEADGNVPWAPSDPKNPPKSHQSHPPILNCIRNEGIPPLSMVGTARLLQFSLE